MNSKKVLISVTPQDVKKGRRFDANSCPIARAINRQLLPKFLVGVGPDDYQVFQKGTYFPVSESVALPDKALRFRESFDRGYRLWLKPIKFYLTLPVSVLK